MRRRGERSKLGEVQGRMALEQGGRQVLERCMMV